MGMLERTRREISIRRAQMIEECNKPDIQPLKWSMHEDLFLESMYVDFRNKLVYCSVLKGGSTFWKRLLAITSGFITAKTPYDIPANASHDRYLDNLNQQLPQRVDAILDSSLKFMFTREPYSRLFSCYVDKVFTPRPFYSRLRDSILLLTRPGWDNILQGRSCAVDVSFAEFFRFVVFSVEKNVAVDPHFIPMYQSCRPCEIKYEFLGKMDTFWRDTNFLLHERGLDNFTGLTNQRSDLDSIHDMVDSAFFEREESEKCLPFSKILQVIWKKAVIRGILSTDKVMPARFLNHSAISRTAFQTSLVEAYQASQRDSSRHLNRKYAMIEAYQTVSREDLTTYQNLFRPDFEIFGYESNRSDIFDSSVLNTSFSFFA
ncbi:carbohydrate sulfotransferase 11-like [Liolophura sinensis]|uniref:carbohydrate sulfotransferase 11-like n=1 Tax=Liolophura sinensis TaxID=3198878 RepID=UPI0031581E6F